MRWQPDPTFYPSPKMAMEAPAEKLAYVAMLNPALRSGTDAMGVIDVDAGSRSYGKMVGRVDMPTRATSCTTSAGMRAVPACAPIRRIRTWNAAILLCPACGRREFTLWTRNLTRPQREEFASSTTKRPSQRN